VFCRQRFFLARRLLCRVFYFRYPNFPFPLCADRPTARRGAMLCLHQKKNGLTERKEYMGILEAAKPAIIICTRDRARSTAFYRDTLGLTLAYEDTFAAVFNIGGVTLRVSTVPEFKPHEHTILGFRVPDVPATVKGMRERGVCFHAYPAFAQDELGIWTAPGGNVRVAWFDDPDGNVLSVTNV
jgi:catechol 2,3-dioxygenase-like lactoylglutathione lyase family enzyme